MCWDEVIHNPTYIPNCIFPKFIFAKCIFAKCTRHKNLLSFVSLFLAKWMGIVLSAFCWPCLIFLEIYGVTPSYVNPSRADLWALPAGRKCAKCVLNRRLVARLLDKRLDASPAGSCKLASRLLCLSRLLDCTTRLHLERRDSCETQLSMTFVFFASCYKIVTRRCWEGRGS